MRVNVYAEEMTERVEIIEKVIEGQTFTGLRLYLELPVTVGRDENGQPINKSGPFEHRPGDDDSSAVTFWGKRDLRVVLRKMLAMLDAHYGDGSADAPAEPTTFENELAALLNRVSAESGSDTPDFILAEYLAGCLDTFNTAVKARERWYGNAKAGAGEARV